MQTTEPTWTERVERLERRSRRTTGAALTMCLFTATVVWMGQTRSKSVPLETRSQKFVLVDGSGKERAELGVLADGAARLIIRNRKSGAATWVGVDSEGRPLLALSGPDGIKAMELIVLDGPSPAVILRDKDGRRRATIGISDAGSGGLFLYDGQGKRRLRATMDRQGDPRMMLSDGRGRPRLVMMITPDGDCALDLRDAKQTRMSFVVADDGKADLVLLRSDGRPVWTKSAP